jgi:uncharacterized membrane protein
MHKEKLGALIDGIYAIALTILVLELPKPESAQNLIEFLPEIRHSFIDYVLSFLLLFAFWYNQRRINEIAEYLNRFTLWLNGIALLFICLIPYSTVILHRYGDNDYVDIFYVANWLIIDALIHIILRLNGREFYKTKEGIEVIKKLFKSRQIITIFTVIIMILAVILPVPNRYALLFVPLLLIFENEIVWLSKTVLIFMKRKKFKL